MNSQEEVAVQIQKQSDKENKMPSEKENEDACGNMSRKRTIDRDNVSREPIHHAPIQAKKSQGASAPNHIRIPRGTKTERGPPSPTDTMLSPVSRAIHNKRRKTAKAPAGMTLSMTEETAKPQETGDKSNKGIILCSSSTQRKELMERLEHAYTTMEITVDDKDISASDPMLLSLRIAHEKINQATEKVEKPALVIAGHQLVTVDSTQLSGIEPRQAFSRSASGNTRRLKRTRDAKDKVIHRPADEQEAKGMITQYSEKPVQVITAVVVMDTETGTRFETVDTSKVHFKTLSQSDIDAIISYTDHDGDWKPTLLSCAGALCIDHPLLSRYVYTVEGHEDAVKGLPLKATSTLLKMAKELPSSNAQGKVAVAIAAHDSHGTGTSMHSSDRENDDERNSHKVSAMTTALSPT